MYQMKYNGEVNLEQESIMYKEFLLHSTAC